MSRYERSAAFRIMGKLVSTILGLAAIVLVSICAAAVIKDTTFTTEWSNMIAWFGTWAK